MNLSRTTRTAAVAGLVVCALAVSARPSAADLTVFLGTTSSSPEQLHKGVSAGFSILVVGFDFEYDNATEDPQRSVPSLHLGSANVTVQTPTGRVRLYGTVGVGVYRETLGEYARTNTSGNVGGGVKIGLLGPLGVRLDYRMITLRNSLRAATQHRVYAGVHVSF